MFFNNYYHVCRLCAVQQYYLCLDGKRYNGVENLQMILKSTSHETRAVETHFKNLGFLGILKRPKKLGF